MARLRAGIVGTGVIAGLGGRVHSHAGGFRLCEGVDLVAIADIDPKRLNQFGEEWEIPPEQRYSQAAEMYEKADLDIVDVTTHNIHHHEPVIQAAEARIKVVMVEKPLSVSVHLGKKMVDACARSGSRLVVDHTRRFVPAYRKLREMVKEGAVGEVRSIIFTGSRPLLHNGTHTVDYAFYFTEARPILVSGYLNDEPVADPGGGGMIVCEGGLVIFINCTATRKESYPSAEIAGTEGRIVFSDRLNFWYYGPMAEAKEAYGTRFDFKPIEMESYEPERYFSFAARECVDCCLKDRESLSSGRDGLKALEVITAIHISHKTGNQVSLPMDEASEKMEILSTGE